MAITQGPEILVQDLSGGGGHMALPACVPAD
jgi:hypothetical protein